MDTQTLINIMLETAEWWLDGTGFLQQPTIGYSEITNIENTYGMFTRANGGHMRIAAFDYYTEARGWFLLLIIADLEYKAKWIPAELEV